ncbi:MULTISPECIES: hypothetical protein [unclassified Spirosoma]|uniref:hypothetical protein n=1 Tax=unclassified Spirosoma TaxID=2621999 RepID=UPI0009621951|nr:MULTISPECIES: hypothetical protein [unclassified Spirosoma]MBN8821023.1 hypothetical protein [Spirosoma sp.]OJW76026.1 MAG: hypothetical protein BGO59_04140 [Spirosoma sp. 48-14]
MNKLYVFLLGILLTTLSIVGCKKEVDIVNPDDPNVPSEQRTGKVCPVGVSLSEAITTAIGPAGGKLTTADDWLTISVPAGAVESNQTFSIQPITNTGPQGLGTAFRLAPHGITFKKPVTIRVHYDPDRLEGTIAQALALAYQTDNGIWRLAANGKIDTTAHTVSVETMHFSDWALLERALLVPSVGFLKTGGNLVLGVRLLTEELFVPIDKEVDVPEPFESPSTVVDYSSWKLVGEGQLIPAAWKAQYKAPATVPARNPVAVTVKLNGPTVIEGKPYSALWLVSNLYIGDEGITYRINGGSWVNTKVIQGAQLVSTPKGLVLMMTGGGLDNGKPVEVTITDLNPSAYRPDGNDLGLIGGVNEYWQVGETGPKFQLSAQGGNLLYIHYYRVGKTSYPSPGKFNISQFGKVGQMITGKFELSKAGLIYPGQESLGTTAHIEGFFQVSRTK